jgi:hypothetical protein
VNGVNRLDPRRAGEWAAGATAHAGVTTIESVAIPSLDPDLLFDVGIEDGVFTRIDAVADGRRDGSPELWPGYVESHAHLGLPANFDGSLDDPRLIALQYLFHGVTRVVDMFGFPLVQALWEKGRAESPVPYPDLAHCGYAATSMRDSAGLTGHGVEFPIPVFMLAVEGDLDGVLRANRERGASFLKLMFTEGVEQPESAPRFSRLPGNVLENVARVTARHKIPCVLDCNTRDEVLRAYGYGFRLFAHPVRDQVLSAADWDGLRGARFVSTLSGLRPMIMAREQFLREYGRPGFLETQDPAALDFVAGVEEPYGVGVGRMEPRTAALATMRANCLQALERGALLLGTDCGNTGAFHGYSLLGELGLLGDGADGPAARGRRDALRGAATVAGSRFFDDLSGTPAAARPITVGSAATFNMLAPTGHGAAMSALPEVTVVDGIPVDRGLITDEIAKLRACETKGKFVL